MTSPLPPAPATGATEHVEPPSSPAPIEELLRLFVKAARAQQLYLPNNPIYRSAIDALRAGFVAVWAELDVLSLEVAETELRWYGVSVLGDPAKSSDNLAWLLYKDGIRELHLERGVEESEIVTLLEIIQKVRRANTESDDLVTMLWEADLTLLKYRYVDLLAEGGDAPLQDGGEIGPPAEPSEIQAAVKAAVAESRASGIVNMADFDSTLYFLEESEVQYLQSEVVREYRQDLRAAIVDTLLDIFEQQPAPEVRTEVTEHLETMLVYMLAASHFRGVAHLLSESQASVGRVPTLDPELRDRLARIADRLSSRDALEQLLQALDDAPSLPPRDELAALFAELRPSALATVFLWLGRTRNELLRELLGEVAGRLAAMNTAELVRLIQAPEREVAAEAIRRAGALRAQAAVQTLAKVLLEPDVARRQVAAQALAEIASPGALQSLERAVEDSDRDVRITAVRALASRQYRPVLARLEGVVRGKGIRETDLTEKMAVFEAYGSLCGDTGVPYLDGLLNGKGFLGRREDPEVRACAAVALGRVGTTKALASLQRASSEKDVVVRSAVSRALRGGTP